MAGDAGAAVSGHLVGVRAPAVGDVPDVVAVSRARGNVLQNALAAYLARWWEHAESAGAGRNGTDVLGTPGVVWEAKTAVDFKRDFRPSQWVEQSKGHAGLHSLATALGHTTDVPVVVYFPPGIGARGTDHALAIMPMHVLMRVLQEAGYTGQPTGTPTGSTTA